MSLSPPRNCFTLNPETRTAGAVLGAVVLVGPEEGLSRSQRPGHSPCLSPFGLEGANFEERSTPAGSTLYTEPWTLQGYPIH